MMPLAAPDTPPPDADRFRPARRPRSPFALLALLLLVLLGTGAAVGALLLRSDRLLQQLAAERSVHREVQRRHARQAEDLTDQLERARTLAEHQQQLLRGGEARMAAFERAAERAADWKARYTALRTEYDDQARRFRALQPPPPPDPPPAVRPPRPPAAAPTAEPRRALTCIYRGTPLEACFYCPGDERC